MPSSSIFTRQRTPSSDPRASTPASSKSSTHASGHNSPLSSTPPRTGPLRPEMTRPDRSHSHTTHSTHQTSAKDSLRNVLGPVITDHRSDSSYRQHHGDINGVQDYLNNTSAEFSEQSEHNQPLINSGSSFLTTSTSDSTHLITPTAVDIRPFPSGKQYQNNYYNQFDGVEPPADRQSTLLRSKFDHITSRENNPSEVTNGMNKPYGSSCSKRSSHLPDDLSPILNKPLMLGHGPDGGYGFPNGQSATGPWGTSKSGNRHSEFGWDTNQNWRYTSQYDPKGKEPEEKEPAFYWLMTTYISYLILIAMGHVRDFLDKRFNKAEFSHLMPSNGYAALMSDFDSFYTRRLKSRLDDCFSRPTTGVAGRTVKLLERETKDDNKTFQLTGQKIQALNISSYNYLGFAQASGGCADAVEVGIEKYGVSSGGSRLEAGTLDLHRQGEKLVSQFIGTEDAMIVSMGFATNSTTIPALVGRGCLVISDEFNHSSIRFGARLSGAAVRSFKHNDMKALDTLLRESISQGQPRTHRPWKKILVIVEGLYSMEGSLVHLPELIVLKERYKFYLYVDEAHSIGALGPNGRGVCDYFGVDPSCVDILMGTFTKSFGASGGYIAGSKEVIDRLRIKSHSMAYAEAISPPVMTQIIASMASIMGVSPPLTAAVSSPVHRPTLTLNDSEADSDREVEMAHEPGPPAYGPASLSLLPEWMHLPPALVNGTEGRERLRRLAFNSRYLSSGLRKLGFVVSGHRDSPIVPLFLFNPGKMSLFSRMMLERVGKDKTPIIVVVVAYPATPLISSRVRFCLSASHTKHDVDLILRACDEVGDLLDLKLRGSRWSINQVIRHAEDLVKEN